MSNISQTAEFVTKCSEKFYKCESLQEEALPQYLLELFFATGLQEFKNSTGNLSDCLQVQGDHNQCYANQQNNIKCEAFNAFLYNLTL